MNTEHTPSSGDGQEFSAYDGLEGADPPDRIDHPPTPDYRNRVSESQSNLAALYAEQDQQVADSPSSPNLQLNSINHTPSTPVAANSTHNRWQDWKQSHQDAYRRLKKAKFFLLDLPSELLGHRGIGTKSEVEEWHRKGKKYFEE